MKAGVDGGTNRRAVNDLVGGFVPDAVCHPMADVFGDSDPVTEVFSSIGGKLCSVSMEVDRFHPRELKERANVGNITCGDKMRLAKVKRGIGDTVKDVSNIQQAMKP